MTAQTTHLVKGVLEEADMSNRRKTDDELELKLLEVTEDPAYRKDHKKTRGNGDVAAEIKPIVVVASTKKSKTLH